MRCYIDATKVPFIALPPALTSRRVTNGARLGDVVEVIDLRTQRCSSAVFADLGPASKLGEGSVALATALALPHDPRRSAAKDSIRYVVFTGTSRGWPLSVEVRDSICAARMGRRCTH